MMSKTYYKVVTKDLKSAIHSNHPQLTVQYKVGEWVKPNIEGSHLMCFESLDEAIDFKAVVCVKSYRCLIYTCEVRYPQKKGAYVSVRNLISDHVFHELRRLLTLKRRKRKFAQERRSGYYNTPTIFANAVKLVKRVY